jgi:hypothetical protein
VRRIAAGESYAAQDIDLEEAPPILVRDLEERFLLEDADVVDENVDLGNARQERIGALLGATSAATPPAASPVSASRASARSTLSWRRPLTMTAAPSSASALAIAKPIPAVDPVTSARRPRRSRSMPILRTDA